LSEHEVLAGLDSEAHALDQNDQSLKTLVGATAGHLLTLLAKTLRKGFKQFHRVEKGRHSAKHRAKEFAKLTDALLSSSAVKLLQKIQDAKVLALDSAADNEKLSFWMQTFAREASTWRGGVDRVLGDQKELLRNEDGEGAAADAELEAKSLMQAELVQKNMGRQLQGLGNFDLEMLKDELAHIAESALAARNASAGQDQKALGELAERYTHQGTLSTDTTDVEGAMALGAHVKERLAQELNEHQQQQQDAHRSRKKGLENEIESFRRSASSSLLEGSGPGRPALEEMLGEQQRANALALQLEAAQQPITAPAHSLPIRGLNALLNESQQLQAEHARLSARHQVAGEVMQKLVTKVAGALS